MFTMVMRNDKLVKLTKDMKKNVQYKDLVG